ncbi:hypothetical protein [Actinomadura bangladeshensis]|uniref:Uncharacterized protein n=1 Tax=Actinomadura bangladeshensis TaxID=453573 RepID=A0A4V2XK75_9ACTN|nr:hypothetical protein [Actinomadura bangladeshensis]TDC05446.1 hypothetical protein E1284_35385 [Actinomadura bangladeshensis]
MDNVRMSGAQTLKQQLPCPYNQDLSSVLRNLDRRTPASRNRLANDPVTAAYLAAGMRLIENHLGPGARRSCSDPDDLNSIERPMLSFLSQRAVAAEVANNPEPFPQLGSVSTLRSSWKSQSDFIADLLRFGLWTRYQENHCVVTEFTDVIEGMIAGPNFVRCVQQLGYFDLLTLIDRPRFRLELIAAAGAEGDEVILNAMTENYQDLLGQWKAVFAEILSARGLRLRTGVCLDDLVGIVAAVAEGVALRALTDPQAGVIDHARHRSLLGTASLALIRGCVERTDDTDGLSLEQAVNAMIYDLPNPAPTDGPVPGATPDKAEEAAELSMQAVRSHTVEI